MENEGVDMGLRGILSLISNERVQFNILQKIFNEDLYETMLPLGHLFSKMELISLLR